MERNLNVDLRKAEPAPAGTHHSVIERHGQQSTARKRVPVEGTCGGEGQAQQPTQQRIDGWHERIRTLLNDAKAVGEISESIDTDIEASALWAYSSGIGQLGVLHPESFPPAHQTALIANYLNKLRSAPRS